MENAFAQSNVANFLIHVCRYAKFLGSFARSLFSPPFYFKELVEQIYQLGYKSLSIVSLTAVFTGMVLSLQTGTEMSRYGAKAYIGSVVAVSLVRELGPVLTALVIAGRVGAGIAAELGSMKVTDQVDALRAMATDPYKKLIVTRIIALMIVVPLLVAIADFVGLLGGALISVTSLNVGVELYRSTALDALLMEDLIMGIIKPFVFACIIGSIACYLGLNTEGGTKGVGSHTTQSVVLSSIAIFLVDFLITKIFFMVGGGA